MPHNGVDDLIGATGVREELCEHRTERDQDPDSGRGAAEPVGERLQYIRNRLAGNNSHCEPAGHERQERVHLGDGDQHDDDGDADERGEDQLPPGGDRLG